MKYEKRIKVAIIILFLIGFTLGTTIGLATAFTIKTIELSEEKMSELLQQQQKAVTSAIGIDAVWNETGMLAFSLKNTGAYTYTEAEVQNFKLYIDGLPSDIKISTLDGKSAAGKGFKSYTGTLTAGGNVSVNTSIPWVSTAGTYRIIRVTPPFGTEATYTCAIRVNGQQYC